MSVPALHQYHAAGARPLQTKMLYFSTKLNHLFSHCIRWFSNAAVTIHIRFPEMIQAGGKETLTPGTGSRKLRLKGGAGFRGELNEVWLGRFTLSFEMAFIAGAIHPTLDFCSFKCQRRRKFNHIRAWILSRCSTLFKMVDSIVWICVSIWSENIQRKR